MTSSGNGANDAGSGGAARRSIRVEALTRVEGEGALDLEIDGGRLSAARLRIYEPPRFFEALLRGRSYHDAPDITARICGICPVAYQMSSAHAIENAFGVRVAEPLRALRRLLYCGEWIESHALHIVLLHAPDFLGLPDGIAMARNHGDALRDGLALKKAGNEILRVLGGREIHPVSVRPGGFHRLPRRAERAALAQTIAAVRERAWRLARWTATLPVPEFERPYEFVALPHPDEYPFNEGRLVSSGGLDLDIADFDAAFEEFQAPHSTALHARLRGRGAYLVGPLARYALNFDRLPGAIQDLARDCGLGTVCRNPFRSIVVRAVEIVYACEEALRILAALPDDLESGAAFVPVAPRAAVGTGCTEAPRGFCWHRYEFAEDGSILAARIVPPTSQNQAAIEEDLRAIAEPLLDRDDETIRIHCERSIRNHDPCISCSTHFLRLAVRRS